MKNGVFNVILGSVVPLDIAFDRQYWLGISIAADDELTPRLQLTSSPYSLNAANSEKIKGYEVSSTPEAGKLLPLDENAKVPLTVLPEIEETAIGGINAGFHDVTITSQVRTPIDTFEITEEGQFDVLLFANLVVEINGDGSGRYEFLLLKGSLNGTVLGRGWWRPPSSASFQAVTISFNGFDADVTTPETYFLVGRKFDSGAKDALVFIHGLHATWVKK